MSMHTTSIEGRDRHHILNGFKSQSKRLKGGGIALFHGCIYEDNLATNKKIKRCDWISGIERGKNGWELFFLDNNGDEEKDPVIVPDNFARFVKIVLWAEARRHKIDKQFTEFVNIKTDFRCFNINCHRFIAGIFGATSFSKKDDGDWGFGNIKPLFNTNDYIAIKSEEDFRNYIIKTLSAGGFGIGQIIGNDDNRVWHSFVVVVSKFGKNVLCVDKENTGHAPFRVLPDDILFSTLAGKKGKLRFIIKPVNEVQDILTKDPRIKK